MSVRHDLRLWVAFRLCHLGEPGAFLALVLVHGPRAARRRWRDREQLR